MLLPIATGRRRRASAFSPLSLSPALWLDAADPATLFQDAARTTPATLDGDPVGAWSDKSGNGRHFTQATSTKRPTLRLASQNGRNTLLLDGVDDCLRNDAVASLLTGTTTPATAVAVARLGALTGNNSVWCAASSADNNAFYRLVAFDGATGYVHQRRNNAADIRGTRTGTSDTTAFLHAATFDGGTGVSRLNGSALVSESLVTAAPCNFSTFAVGCWPRQTGEIQFLGGRLMELLIFTSALPVSQVQQLEVYLKAKWGTP